VSALTIDGGDPVVQLAESVGPRVLVVDDEQRILDFVGRALRAEGFAADTAADGSTALDLATAAAYDLVILDLAMPGSNGVEVLQELIVRRPQQRVLVLSARSDIDSKVACFNLGADDYLTKPFSLDELLARVRARLRVARRYEAGRRAADAARQQAGLWIDVERQEVDAGSGRVPLSRREFLLLRELMKNSGCTVSKERLLSAVWGFSHHPGSNVVDVYVRRLRAKLGDGIVKTVRGEGYRIDANG
jgi:DNA-binding response OmpR family regulator